jgi:hypothetical protein
MKLGKIRPAPRKPAPKKLAPVKPALKKPTPVRPTPSPGLPRSPDRGNVEQNYRGIPGLVNAAAPIPRGIKPTPSPGLPTIPERGTGIPAYDNPRMISPGPTPPSGGATGSTGFKSAFGGIDSNMLAPSGGAPGNTSDLARAASAAGVSKTPYMGGLPQTPQPNSARLMMKKGGEVKASKAPKASSASKRGDGIATKGKTKGRFV